MFCGVVSVIVADRLLPRTIVALLHNHIAPTGSVNAFLGYGAWMKRIARDPTDPSEAFEPVASVRLSCGVGNSVSAGVAGSRTSCVVRSRRAVSPRWRPQPARALQPPGHVDADSRRNPINATRFFVSTSADSHPSGGPANDFMPLCALAREHACKERAKPAGSRRLLLRKE